MSDLKYTELPGAEVALRYIALKSRWPGELDGSLNDTRYSRHKYNPETGKHERVRGHYVSYVNCSDTFFWGSADAEEVTEENIHIFEELIELLAPKYREYDKLAGEEARSDKLSVAHAKWKAENPDKIDENGNTPEWRKSPEFKEANAGYEKYFRLREQTEATLEDLFAARSRGIRPQGACYSRYPEEFWPLFDACGPERETGFGNPYKPGEYNR